MIFPAQAGGMSSLLSLVPPGLGVWGPCAQHSVCPPGGRRGPSRMLGVLGLHPTQPWQKCQLSLGTRGKGGEKRVVSLPRSLGPPWLSLMDDTTYFTLGSHWHFPQPCGDIRAALPGTPEGRWHPQVVALL